MSSTCVLLSNRSVLRITGNDRLSFLQSLVSNDLTQLSPEKALYTLLLTPQGKFQDDFFVVAQGEALFLTPEREEAEALKNRLSLYKLRSHVTLDLLDTWHLGSHPVPSALPCGTVLREHPFIEFVDPRLSALGTLLLGSFSIDTSLNFDLYDTHRLSLGVPDGGRDMIRGKAIPLENGLDQLNAIDWNKGCYLGQELTSRTKYVGQVRKGLRRLLKEEGPMPYFDEPLFQGDKEVGRMRSSCGLQGLALLRLDEIPYDGEVSTKDGSTLKVCPSTSASPIDGRHTDDQ